MKSRKLVSPLRQRPKTSNSWRSSPISHSRLIKPLQTEITSFNEIITKYQSENKVLRNLISSINESSEQSKPNHFLVKYVDQQISLYFRKINERAMEIDQLEKNVNASRVILGGQIEDKLEKTRLLGENERLIDQALLKERQTVVLKMRLQMNHDHRKLCELRNKFEAFKNGEQTIDDDEFKRIEAKKIAIANLKEAINHEKKRIENLNSQYYKIHRSATIIQSLVRGWIVRQQEKRRKLAEKAAEELRRKEEEEKARLEELERLRKEEEEEEEEDYSEYDGYNRDSDVIYSDESFEIEYTPVSHENDNDYDYDNENDSTARSEAEDKEVSDEKEEKETVEEDEASDAEANTDEITEEQIEEEVKARNDAPQVESTMPPANTPLETPALSPRALEIKNKADIEKKKLEEEKKVEEKKLEEKKKEEERPKVIFDGSNNPVPLTDDFSTFS